MHGSSPGSSARGISETRILEWVAVSSSRGSSRPRDQTQVSYTASRFFTSEPEEPIEIGKGRVQTQERFQVHASSSHTLLPFMPPSHF